jgi:hypothetical protein
MMNNRRTRTESCHVRDRGIGLRKDSILPVRAASHIVKHFKGGVRGPAKLNLG